jgi:hypothetical protein
MNVNAPHSNKSNELLSFRLRDYVSAGKVWRVRARGDLVIDIGELEGAGDGAIDGIIGRLRIDGSRTSIAFLSGARDERYAGVPGYSKHLLLLIGEKLLGDGFLVPRITFEKTHFSCRLHARSADGWEFRKEYRRPWFREFFRKALYGSSIDYDPVDIVERLVEVVRVNRPHWLVEEVSR